MGAPGERLEVAGKAKRDRSRPHHSAEYYHPADEEGQEPSKGLIWKIIYLSSFQGGLLKSISQEKRNQLQ